MKAYQVRIKICGSFIVGSGFGYARMADTVSVRDEDGIAIIPGSTVKGRLRSICKRIALSLEVQYDQWQHDKAERERRPVCQVQGEGNTVAAVCKHYESRCVICRIFGSPLYASPYRFSDLSCEEDMREQILLRNSIRFMQASSDAEWVTRTKRNRYTNGVEEKSLFTIEQIPTWERTYAGTITGPELHPKERHLIECGLRTLTHLGGGKARGLGRIRSATIVEI
ncbi:MAG: RAMP superfamily CRISPR-associated protein [bacterium]